MELCLETAENPLETIDGVANFLKLLLVMGNLFEHLLNFQNNYLEHLQ